MSLTDNVALSLGPLVHFRPQWHSRLTCILKLAGCCIDALLQGILFVQVPFFVALPFSCWLLQTVWHLFPTLFWRPLVPQAGSRWLSPFDNSQILPVIVRHSIRQAYRSRVVSEPGLILLQCDAMGRIHRCIWRFGSRIHDFRHSLECSYESRIGANILHYRFVYLVYCRWPRWDHTFEYTSVIVSTSFRRLGGLLLLSLQQMLLLSALSQLRYVGPCQTSNPSHTPNTYRPTCAPSRVIKLRTYSSTVRSNHVWCALISPRYSPFLLRIW